MAEKDDSSVKPVEIGKSLYNRESGKKTLMLVGTMITLIVLSCVFTFLLYYHIVKF